MSYITNIISQYPKVFLIILIIVVLLILFLYILPLIFKFVGKRQNAKETTALKKDLMIWRRISNLARGGKSADKSKLLLAKERIELLRNSFSVGLEMLRANGRRLYEAPWYICIGEPGAGKSAILTSPELNMLVSENENLDSKGNVKSASLRFWLGRKAVVLEVGGKAFFDRWFGGSSAEFNEVIKLVDSKHSKKPLSGIILAIPADALIADNEELSQKKASLIAIEFSKLVYKLSMNLPCYVVVTKLDLITGFRDYFSRLDDNLRSKVFGWDNHPYGNGYNKEVFDGFWQETLQALREGRNMLLLPKTAPMGGSFNDAGNIYMFPESFNSLYANLDVYLKTIFGAQGYVDDDNLRLEGVYFTSSKDEGIALNEEYAKLKNMPLEDAPMHYGIQNSRSFFIGDLLNNRIFSENHFASLSNIAKMKRNLPYYAVAACFIIMGVIWCTAGIFGVGRVNNIINGESAYYKKIEVLLTNKILDNSPLVATDEEGKGVLLFDKPMFESDDIERIAFFSKAYNQATSFWEAPYGFKMSSLIKYGQTNMAFNERQFIFNKIQTRMAFLPILYSIERNLQMTVNNPVSALKRDAIFELLKIAALQENDSDVLRNYSKYRENAMKAFMSYMFPSFTPETRKILTAYNIDYDRNLTATNLEILLSPGYALGYESGIKSIIGGWQQLNNYPEAPYSLQKNLINYGSDMESLYNKLKAFDPLPLDPYSIAPIKLNVEEWVALYKDEKKTAENITNALNRLWDYYKENIGSDMGNKINLSLMLPPAYLSYEQQLISDFNMLETYGRVNVKRSDGYSVYHSLIETSYLKKIRDDVNRKLQNEYSIVKERMATVNNNLFFKEGQNSDNSTIFGSNSNYIILDNLLRNTIHVNANMENNNTGSFEKIWKNNESLIISQSEQLAAYIKRYGGNVFVDTLAGISQKMLDMQASYSRITLGNALFELYPSSVSELMTKVYELPSPSDGTEKLLVKSTDAAPGKIGFQSEFNPVAINFYIKPMGMLRSFRMGREKSGVYDYASEYFQANPRYLAHSRMMESYNENFIKYWANFGDSLSPNVSSYSAFYNFVNSAKAYRINSMLYSVYDKSFELLSGINDSLLSPLNIASKNNALTLITDRRNTLNANYSDYCTKLLDTWAALPSSALEADKVLMSTSNRRLQSDYLVSQSDDSYSKEIPWWRNLFQKGVKVIKAEVFNDATDLVKNYQRYFNKFPLLADGNVRDVLSYDDIKELVTIFKDFGWFLEGNQQDNESGGKALEIKETVKLNKIIRNESEMKKIGVQVKGVLDALGGASPLEWTLVIPDAEVQSSLVSRYSSYPSAMARFRYVDVTYLSSRDSKRIPTSAGLNKEITVAKGNADVRDLIFNFYIHSDSKLPEANIKISGAWAPIRFYLKSGVVKDSEKKIHYIPLLVKDYMDIDYIFYIGIKFNKPLPEPSEWPTSGKKTKLN